MDNNIGIFFDDNQYMNPCLIDEEMIKKVIDTKDNDTFIKKWYVYIIDYLKNNYNYIIIIIIIILFLLYRFHINKKQQYDLDDLNKKKNIIIDTLIKKYEKHNDVVDILNEHKDIENKQKKILNNLNKIKKKKKLKNIDNFDNNFSNYYHI